MAFEICEPEFLALWDGGAFDCTHLTADMFKSAGVKILPCARCIYTYTDVGYDRVVSRHTTYANVKIRCKRKFGYTCKTCGD